MMFERLKKTKTLKLFVGTILAALGGMLLPETNSLHLSMMDGIQVIIATVGMLFLRDGIAK